MRTRIGIAVGMALACLLVRRVTAGQQTMGQVEGKPVSTMVTPSVNSLLTRPVSQITAKDVASMQRQLADWPQLARYQAENERVGAPANGERRVVFFGDSITDHWGRQHGRFFPDKPWINRGIGGQTTPQMLVRFQQDVLSLKPEAVVILAGINDIAGNSGPETLPVIEANFRSMVTLAKAAHVRVVLCSVLPAKEFPWHPGVDPRDEEKMLNAWLQEYATSERVTFLNYYPAMVAADGGMRPELGVDAVHPNDAGYAVMEPLARQAVERVLAQARP